MMITKPMLLILRLLAILVGIMVIAVVIPTILGILGVGIGFRLGGNLYASEVYLKTYLWLLGVLLVVEAVLLLLLRSTWLKSKF